MSNNFNDSSAGCRGVTTFDKSGSTIVRTDELVKKVAATDLNHVYRGRALNQLALETDPVWQIQRIVYIDGIEVEKQFANGDYGYCFRWDQRTTYFSGAPTGDSSDIFNVTGTFTPTGLKNSGRVTRVVLNDSTWTSLPGSSLSNRNAVGIQNRDIGVTNPEILVGYSLIGPPLDGMIMSNKGERFYDITDAIVIYGKVVPGGGTCTVRVEELS